MEVILWHLTLKILHYNVLLNIHLLDSNLFNWQNIKKNKVMLIKKLLKKYLLLLNKILDIVLQVYQF